MFPFFFQFPLLRSHSFLLRLSCSGLSWLLHKFSIVQDLQFFLQQVFGSSPLFLEYNMYKTVIQLIICHRFLCIVIITNFLVYIISNHFRNAIYSLFKHDDYPFSVGFISNVWSIRSFSTWGTIPWPYTLSNLTVFWKSHLTCLYVHYVFQTPWSFFFLFWCGLTIILRLLSSVTSNSVLSFQMSKFFCLVLLPHHMPNTNVLTWQSLA